jgi:hypothetical protein
VNADGSTFTGVAPAESAKVLLSRAESDDVKLLKINNRNVIQVIDRDTVDITMGANGKLNATSTGVGLNGDVLIGSEGVVNVNLVKSTDDQDVRIKAYGSINNARTDTGAAVVGGNIVLESASGSVGSESAVMRIDQKQDASLVARAKTEMVISTHDQQVAGRAVDLRISSAYSPNTIHLTSKQGAILDNAWTGEGSIENGWGTDIKAATVHLTAAKSVGLMPATGDTNGTIRGKALEIASVEKLDADGNPLQSVVIDGALTNGVNAMTPLTETVRYTSVAAAGDIRLDTQREMTVDGAISSIAGEVVLTADNAYGAANQLTVKGTVTTQDHDIKLLNSNGSTTVNAAIDSAGGNVVIATGEKTDMASTLNLSGSIRTHGGDIEVLNSYGNITANVDWETGGGRASITTGNRIEGTSQLIVAGSIATEQGNIDVVSGVGHISANADLQTTSGNIAIQSLGSYGAITKIDVAGRLQTNTGSIGISNELGNIYLGNGQQKLEITSASGDLNVLAKGVYDVSKALDHQVGDIRMAQGSSVDTGTGRISLDAGVGLYFSNLKTSSTDRNAVSLRAFDVVDNVGGKNDAADITLRDSGGLSIKAYRFADINNIDYKGAGDLHIDLLGANSNNNASAAAVALGINSNAPVVFDRLYTGYAAVAVKGMTSFEVTQGRITRTGYFDLNGVLGRVGDIDYPGINYALWTREAGGETSAFQNPAMVDGYRKQDFIVSGAAATTGLSIMLYNLKANWNGARPVVTTDGYMLSYSRARVSYQSPDGETMSIDERTTMATMLGMNLRILNSIGLKLEFYNAFAALNQAPTGLGNKRFIQNAAAQTADGQASEEEGSENAFPANFPPSILDAEITKLDGLNLTGVNTPDQSVQ